MKNPLLKATVAFLFAVAMSFSIFSSQALALGGFSQTCYDSNLSGPILTSSCEKADGYTLETSFIDLNGVIENVDGSLEWQPDNFFETCRNLELVSPSAMVAECKTRAQYWNDTIINLDEHIANINGVLTYE